jgi:hypothetical protein
LKQPGAWLGDEAMNIQWHFKLSHEGFQHFIYSWLGDEAMNIQWHFKLSHEGFQHFIYSTEQNKSVAHPCLQQLLI